MRGMEQNEDQGEEETRRKRTTRERKIAERKRSKVECLE